MKSISAGTFQRFIGFPVQSFMPRGTLAEDLDGIRVQRTTVADLVDKTCQDRFFDGSMGESKTKILYYAVCEDSTILPPPNATFSFGSNYANSQSGEGEGVTLGDAWGEELGKIKYVVEYRRECDDWPGKKIINEMVITLHLVRDVDEERIRRIRRRSEDALRKSDATTILRVATALGVKLD